MEHPEKVLDRIGMSARKRFSQNFLVSEKWALKMAEPLLAHEGLTEVWELGPGLGAITDVLVKGAQCPVKLFEIDWDLIEHLKERFPSCSIVEGDFLQVNLSAISPGKSKIGFLSNLPYHISSPIFFKLVECRERFSVLVLTFQKELADRLLSAPGSKVYGATSVLAQYCFSMRSLGNLPMSAFHPAPQVASQALTLIPKQEGEVDYESLSKVVKCAFQHRRKKMLKNLTGAFPSIAWKSAMERVGVSTDARAEQVSLDQFVSLTESAFANKPAKC